ncbi:MAG: YihA family ribosome biogenesis GTP-binding protein [Eubacteriaceae bacterium]|nr:YihA family ribosome biogenesis GTP-binding protein [Eubacteriaceae bacterium]MBR5996007.1 YihA family ribosome biogenesis GTP-binding protein [Eubacteriaceae bacterium]
MIIKSAVLASSQTDISRFPSDGRFEIALVGRSNVGKSTFINTVTGRKGLARTSSSPGKTRTANFYLINDEFYFVDLPGYGYAKASKGEQRTIKRVITSYIEKRQADIMVLQLVDHRIPPQASDLEMRQYLLGLGMTPVTVLTKTDKVKPSERDKTFRAIIEGLGIAEDEAVFEFSSQNGKMTEDIKDFIGEMICSI